MAGEPGSPRLPKLEPSASSLQTPRNTSAPPFRQACDVPHHIQTADMDGWLEAVRSNVSFINMRSLLGQVPLLAFLSATASHPSYHDDAGVLAFVNPKIGTYGVTPNGNGGRRKNAIDAASHYCSD